MGFRISATSTDVIHTYTDILCTRILSGWCVGGCIIWVFWTSRLAVCGMMVDQGVWLRGEMGPFWGSDLGYFDPNTIPLYARARTMIP